MSRVIVCADAGDYVVNVISPETTMTSVAGEFSEGHIDGLGNQARFKVLQRIPFDRTGNVLLCARR